MYRFIYVSHASKGLNFEDLGGISAVSKACNQRDKLTGLLFWAEGAFVQLLEGPKPELDATISRVEADQRHSGMICLCYREVSEPICKDWAMGCYPMPALGFQSAFFNAPSVNAIVQRFNATRDAELEALFSRFYQDKVGGDQRQSAPVARTASSAR